MDEKFEKLRTMLSYVIGEVNDEWFKSMEIGFDPSYGDDGEKTLGAVVLDRGAWAIMEMENGETGWAVEKTVVTPATREIPEDYDFVRLGSGLRADDAVKLLLEKLFAEDVENALLGFSMSQAEKDGVL